MTRPVPSEESALARRLIDGDSAAFDRFVEIFQHKLFHFTFLTCGHREDAEEVAQETLLKVFQSFDQLREPESIKPWIFTIARNVCRMKRRKSRFAPEHELPLDEPGDGERARTEIADPSELPDAQVIHGELREALRRAIASLPELYRSVLLLRDVEELSTEEAAKVLGVSVANVKTRLHRARAMLRKAIEAHPFEGAVRIKDEVRLPDSELPAPIAGTARQEMINALRSGTGGH